MNFFEQQGSRRGTEDVGQQVVGIVPTAAWGESLVVLVQPADQCNHEDSGRDYVFPIWPHGTDPEQTDAEQTTAAEEITEMLDLVEMRDRWRVIATDGERGTYPQDCEPEQECAQPELRIPWNLRHPQSLRISSSSRSASHCFIID